MKKNLQIAVVILSAYGTIPPAQAACLSSTLWCAQVQVVKQEEDVLTAKILKVWRAKQPDPRVENKSFKPGQTVRMRVGGEPVRQLKKGTRVVGVLSPECHDTISNDPNLKEKLSHWFRPAPVGATMPSDCG